MHTAIEPLETRIAPATIFAIDNANGLVSFDSADPTVVSTTTPVTGLQAGEVLKTIDFRPADGLLYGIALSGAAMPFTGRLYQIDVATGAATAVGASPFSTGLTVDTGFASDFDPVADTLRVVAGISDAHLVVNPTTGDAYTDVNITGPGVVSGLAYSNNFGGATSATLYAIDFGGDDLHRIGGFDGEPSPSAGIGTKIADISVVTAAGTQDRLGFDILTTLEGSTAFYTGFVNSKHRFYTLNLATGAATEIGLMNDGNVFYLDIAAQAPRVSFTGGKSFTYTDADGDLVTVKTSAGTLKPTQFGWLPSADGTRFELTQMKIAGDAAFGAANISVTAKKTATGGDGRADVGHLDATGLNLGVVKIGGNIERINVGTNSATTPALKSFSALSMGHVADGVIGSVPASVIAGKVPLFTVKGDFSQVRLSGFTADIFTIGGSVIGGDSFGAGRITGTVNKAFAIGGSIFGGMGESTGSISITGNASIAKIGGSIIGGSMESAGGASITTKGSLLIAGSIIGGSAQSAGSLFAGSTLATVKIGGGIVGGDGSNSGGIIVNAIKSVTISGSIVGGKGTFSGALNKTGTAPLTIGGSIIGGGSSGAGFVSVGDSSVVTIGGSIIGSGNGGRFEAGNIKTFALGGSVVSGDTANFSSGTLSFITAMSVTIKGGVIGKSDVPVVIAFTGKAAPASVAESIAVGTLTIKGSVANSQILIGGESVNNLNNVNAAAGTISIGGDFLASSISAGIETGNDSLFGTADDEPGAMGSLPDIKAAIGSIIIKGRATGTLTSGDSHAIQAEEIRSVTIAGRKVALDPLAQDNQLVGPYADFRIREVAIP